jgi:hypothetical protein
MSRVTSLAAEYIIVGGQSAITDGAQAGRHDGDYVWVLCVV